MRKKVSPARAQDWISGALNPIIEGLRRELRFLPAGPWRWLHQTRAFEYLHPIRDYVPEVYVDNYEDFSTKYPDVRPELDKHDAALKELTDAVARGFETLAGDGGADFRSELKRFVEPSNVDEIGQRSFLAHLASGHVNLPSSYSDYAVYDAIPQELRGLANSLLGEARPKAQAAGKELETIDKQLVDRLRSLRTEIADRYGARIIPVLD